MLNVLKRERDALAWRASLTYQDCTWWGWWLIYPLDNLKRVVRNWWWG